MRIILKALHKKITGWSIAIYLLYFIDLILQLFGLSSSIIKDSIQSLEIWLDQTGSKWMLYFLAFISFLYSRLALFSSAVSNSFNFSFSRFLFSFNSCRSRSSFTNSSIEESESSPSRNGKASTLDHPDKTLKNRGRERKTICSTVRREKLIQVNTEV